MVTVRLRRGFLLAPCGALVLLTAQAHCQVPRDNHSDEWVATDALGRSIQHTTDPRPNRTVAMFYFLWLGPEAHGGGPWDISHILAQDPDALRKRDSPLWGPVGAAEYWGEPLFGYYNADDPWVLRKHAQMLADAGVDLIIFDTSNKATYPQQATALFKTFAEERAAGNKTPAIAFLTPFWDPASTVERLWTDIYSKDAYKDLWFRLDGKPLILADPAKVSPQLRNAFTFRRPQPDYFQGPTRPNEWSWLEVAPQHVFRNAKGEAEEMSVGVAQNAADGKLNAMSNGRSLGRSFHGNAFDTRPGAEAYGYNFAEQWENALKADPNFVFVTGWNEWIAGRFNEFSGYNAPVIFVDEFDQEHSRDIEPMHGGHGDNYYYQLVENIRKYKGSRAPRLAGPAHTIDLDKGFEQWNDVTPEYWDETGDTSQRDHPGYNSETRLTNNTGRNDLVRMKVAWDADNLYFYAETREALTPSNDHNWMTLFLNVDRDVSTGWHGYDFLLNHRMKNVHTSILEATRNGWNWEPAGEAAFRAEGNKLMMRVSRAQLGLTGGQIHLEFKWADNWQTDDNLDEFLLNGDTAPLGRFNYLFTTDGK